MLRLIWDNETGEADLNCRPEGTETGYPLETAVLLSLFTDARAEMEELKPDTDLRGWWAEQFFDEADVWGSKIWLLETRKATTAALLDAQSWAEASLHWMIIDGIARKVEVETWWLEGRQGYMGILVNLYKPDSTAPQYIGPWEVYYGLG